MYRTTKKKVVKRASLSIVISLGVLVMGVGVANAAEPVRMVTHVSSPSASRTLGAPSTVGAPIARTDNADSKGS
jgi:hypothetical protein